MIKYKNTRIIDVDDWDRLVSETYNRPYSFQQLDGCKDRGYVHITVPDTPEDYENDTVPEVVNHSQMGVSFKAWLERNPTQLLIGKDRQDKWSLGLWWDRNFYPHVSMVINDLHEKGLIEKGDYVIDINW